MITEPPKIMSKATDILASNYNSLNAQLKIKFSYSLATSAIKSEDLKSIISNIDSKFNEKQETPLFSYLSPNLRWQKLPLIFLRPCKNLNFLCSSALIYPFLYIFGGRNSMNKLSSSIFTISLSTRNVTKISPMTRPCKRSGSSLISYNNILVLFGGKDNLGNFLNDVWVFDTELMSWTLIPIQGNKPGKRSGHCAEVIENLMIVYGGSGPSIYYSDMWIYNIAKCHWILMCFNKKLNNGYLLYGRQNAASASFESKMFIFGGISENSKLNNELIKFEIKSFCDVNCSVVGQKSLKPLERQCSTLTFTSNTKLFLIGGESTTGILNDIWLYDLVKDVWEEVNTFSKIKTGLGHCANFIRNEIIVFGGISSDCLMPTSIFSLSIAHNLKSYSSHITEVSANAIKIKDFKSIFSNRFPPVFGLAIDTNCSNKYSMFYSTLNLKYDQVSKYMNMYINLFPALLRIIEFFGFPKINFSIIGTINYLGSTICKISPEKNIPSFNWLRVKKNDTTINLRQNLLRNYTRYPATEKSILQISFSGSLNPELLYSGFFSSKLLLFLPAIFKIDSNFLITSKSVDHLSLSYIFTMNSQINLIFIVYNSSGECIFPPSHLYYPSISNILPKTHFNSIKEIFALEGTNIFLYNDKLKTSVLYDIIDDCWGFGDYVRAALIFDKSNRIDVRINGRKVEKAHMNMEKISACKDFQVYMTMSPVFAALVYYGERLVHWQYKSKPENLCKIVEIFNQEMICEITGMLIKNSLVI
ncbi:hypothetical protein SteCoe_21492 [Stentor coeruleus]|uniref:Uncharacterized protein n=1 Tax=Stentor coeruleus TaxID=5963 RepID=A0A1R2BPL9_9CILI|nr:hypothetical protein SteCoe_21492 [Stentor coeruleus]